MIGPLRVAAWRDRAPVVLREDPIGFTAAFERTAREETVESVPSSSANS